MNAVNYSNRLQILLIGDQERLDRLESALNRRPRAEVVQRESSAEYAFRSVSRSMWSNIEAVFIDPFADEYDPYQSSNFILTARATHPDVVFVLLASRHELLRRKGEFAPELHSRIGHYYFLDPKVDLNEMAIALTRAVEACLAWRARTRPVASRRDFEYDVTISFAGEDRQFAQSLAD